MANIRRRAQQRREGGKEGRSEEDFTKRLVILENPTSIPSEAYRTLRTNLLYAKVDNPPKLVMLTSSFQGEGKSTTCANLGVALAQAAKKTLVIDCDFRRPVLHRFFGLRNVHGTVDVLSGQRRLEETWQEPVEGLKVLPVGPIPLDPAEMLGSQRFSNFLISLREEFDYVLVDASPVGLVSDPAIIATKVDGVLLILDAQKTRKVALRRAVRSLDTVGAAVLGTVVNNFRAYRGDDNYYTYSYNYTHQ